MPEPVVDTLDYLTDEQLIEQTKDNIERRNDLRTAMARNIQQGARLANARIARGARLQ